MGIPGGMLRAVLLLLSSGCAHRGAGPSAGAETAPVVPEPPPADSALADLRASLLTARPGGPDTGDLSRICVDVPPMLGRVERVGVEDPYEILNPPYGWVQVETFMVPMFNQVLVFRGDPPRPERGGEPTYRSGHGMGLFQVETWREAGGERLTVHCLGEAGQSDTLEQLCRGLLLRACGGAEPEPGRR